jgi:hypothetical protein
MGIMGNILCPDPMEAYIGMMQASKMLRESLRSDPTIKILYVGWIVRNKNNGAVLSIEDGRIIAFFADKELAEREAKLIGDDYIVISVGVSEVIKK